MPTSTSAHSQCSPPGTGVASARSASPPAGLTVRIICRCMSIRILTAALTLLAVVCGRQYSDIRGLRLCLTACTLDSRRAAADTIAGQGAEISRTLAWLHGYYQAPEGLQRPSGLWIEDHPDFDGIAHWVVDVYLRNRLGGRTEAEARQVVEAAIRKSDEWRTKHPASP
jgi:hypothetical protein